MDQSKKDLWDALSLPEELIKTCVNCKEYNTDIMDEPCVSCTYDTDFCNWTWDRIHDD